MKVHGYIASSWSDAYLRTAVPTLDMIEPAWDVYPEGARLAATYGKRPDAKLIAYKLLPIFVNTDRNLIGKAPAEGWPESVYLHRQDGQRVKPSEFGYNNPAALGVLNPSDPFVRSMALAEQIALINMGYNGVRYDEAVVGYTDHVEVDWSDCAEFGSRSAYERSMAGLCNDLRMKHPDFLQLPSIADFERFDHFEINRACRGVSSENFPTGVGLLADWRHEGIDGVLADFRRRGITITRERVYGYDGNNVKVGATYEESERNIVAASALLEWLDRRYDYSAMFFSTFPKGLGSISRLAERIGRHQIYWNLDLHRDPVSGRLPPWIS